MRIKSWLLMVFLLEVWCLAACPRPARATTEYAFQTDRPCTFCHVDPEGGGPLTLEGEKFRQAGFSVEQAKAPLLGRRVLHLVVGFLHIVAAVIWFGAIFYIHIFVKPQSLIGGLPKRERILGWSCILTVALTGTILTLLRLRSLEYLWTTTFGIVWMVKVGFFLLMVAIAVVATTTLHRRMRRDREAKAGAAPTPQKPAEEDVVRVIFQGQMYDASSSPLWRGGVHMGMHSAGTDLTQAMTQAPHGPEVLERLKKLGPAPKAPPPVPGTAARVFVVLSYVILGCMLVILFCLAYWNWGPPLVVPTS